MTNDQQTTDDARSAYSQFGSDGIANKIAGLLAKAESTTNEHERDAFNQKAAALMARYQIDQLILNRAIGGKVLDDKIESLSIVFDHTAYHIAFKDFMTAIGEAFGFKIVWRSDRKAGWWYGFKSDLALAETIYASLLIQVATASAAYLKTPAVQALPKRMDKHVAKRSFIQGFGTGAAHKIMEGRREAKDEASVDHGEDNVLPVLASREDELTAYFNETVMPRLGKASVRAARGDRSASSAGYNAGRRADVGQSQANGRRAIDR